MFYTWKSLLFCFSHLFQGIWLPCQEVDMTGGATNDVYFYLILLPDNLPSKLPHPLWTSCEFVPSPYGREKGTNSQRAEDFAYLWFVASDACGSYDSSGETMLLLCSGAGCFDMWCWQEWDKRIISVCGLVEDPCALRGHLEKGAVVGLGSRDPAGDWGLTDWLMNICFPSGCFDWFMWFVSVMSLTLKTKSPRNSYTRSTQDNHKAYVCQYNYSFCHVGKYLNSIYNLGHTREFSGCIYIA